MADSHAAAGCPPQHPAPAEECRSSLFSRLSSTFNIRCDFKLYFVLATPPSSTPEQSPNRRHRGGAKYMTISKCLCLSVHRTHNI